MESVPLLSEGETIDRRPRCRTATAMLFGSLLVNALLLSAIMTEEVERNALHVVAKTNQLRAVEAKRPAIPPAVQAKHPANPPAVEAKRPANPPAIGSGVPSSDQASESGLRGRTYHGITDSSAAIEKKQRSAVRALEQARVSKKPAAKERRPDQFKIDEYRAALLHRRMSRMAGEKPSLPLHPKLHLRGADENPNLAPEMDVDSRGAFFDPKLHALVDARLLGTRSSSSAQYAQVMACICSASRSLPGVKK